VNQVRKINNTSEAENVLVHVQSEDLDEW